MKKQYVSLLTIILSASALLFSCGDKMNKNTGGLTFDSIRVNQTVHLFGDTAKPACNLVISFAYPVQASDQLLKDSIDAYFLAACFGDKYIGLQPQEAVKQYTQAYANEYRRDLEPMYAEDEKNKEDGTSIGSWYSYYKTIKSNVQLYDKNLLVYRIYYDEFTGGAHGIYSTTFLNIDLSTLRPLHLSDLLIEDYSDALTDLLWKELMAANKVTTREALEELGYGSTGEIAPTENFYLDSEGFTFYYNIYEITPYSMGPVEINIPFEAMAPLLGSNPLIEELRAR